MVQFKSRWVLFQVSADPIIENGVVVYPKTQLDLDEKLISRHIFQTVEENYGDFGKGQGSVSVKWYNSTTRIDIYLVSMFYLKKIMNIPCSLHVLHVSGTIIAIQQKAIEWDRAFYLKEQAEADKRGDTYSSIEKIEASEKSLAALQ
ncbi:unnamed protein product [Mucor hiemalis]